ncbi:MAG: DUF423 domain-containing protein [Phaeospirillum sp.]|nr:DUF423 domain-containing protein [Phaeospirillum sp.]
MRPWIFLAGVNGTLALGFASYGAHGVHAGVAPLVEQGSLFQLIHAVVLLSVDRLAGEGRRRAAIGGALIALGVLLFSGSLYFKALIGPFPIPMVTPAGGVSLILGWIMLAAAAFGGNRPATI